MPVSPADADRLIHIDALLELARMARAFAAAMTRAAEMGEKGSNDSDDALAVRVLDECRAALLPALVRAPGMLQIFATPNEGSTHGMASHPTDDVPAA